ncbi:hypothetical protein HRI_002239700 [Hibiscus trionum]|uniref:Uncharacterized protein n=1 Tax=Hibiscus trionum TaxID=183268 RepID=A0A9W7HXZ7_HIBTR|nr:hypothetical protein HRI_002239700 [Hibiscus trionum]
MDIEPLWDLGGWLFLFTNCMAAPKTPSTVIATAAESFAKSHSFLLFLLLTFFFFIFLLHFNPTSRTHPMNSPNVTPSIPLKRLLLHASSKPSTSTHPSMNFHPKQTRNPRASSSKKSSPSEFGAEAHEVPSGANPISNR